LLNHGVEITPTALKNACLSYKTRGWKAAKPDSEVFDLVRSLLERGAEVTDELLARFDLDGSDDHGDDSASNRLTSPELYQILVEHKANQQGQDGLPEGASRDATRLSE
jgi:hypothetical protein